MSGYEWRHVGSQANFWATVTLLPGDGRRSICDLLDQASVETVTIKYPHAVLEYRKKPVPIVNYTVTMNENELEALKYVGQSHSVAGHLAARATKS